MLIVGSHRQAQMRNAGNVKKRVSKVQRTIIARHLAAASCRAAVVAQRLCVRLSHDPLASHRALTTITRTANAGLVMRRRTGYERRKP